MLFYFLPLSTALFYLCAVGDNTPVREDISSLPSEGVLNILRSNACMEEYVKQQHEMETGINETPCAYVINAGYEFRYFIIKYDGGSVVAAGVRPEGGVHPENYLRLVVIGGPAEVVPTAFSASSTDGRFSANGLTLFPFLTGSRDRVHIPLSQNILSSRIEMGGIISAINTQYSDTRITIIAESMGALSVRGIDLGMVSNIIYISPTLWQRNIDLVQFFRENNTREKLEFDKILVNSKSEDSSHWENKFRLLESFLSYDYNDSIYNNSPLRYCDAIIYGELDRRIGHFNLEHNPYFFQNGHVFRIDDSDHDVYEAKRSLNLVRSYIASVERRPCVPEASHP